MTRLRNGKKNTVADAFALICIESCLFLRLPRKCIGRNGGAPQELLRCISACRLQPRHLQMTATELFGRRQCRRIKIVESADWECLVLFEDSAIFGKPQKKRRSEVFAHASMGSHLSVDSVAHFKAVGQNRCFFQVIFSELKFNLIGCSVSCFDCLKDTNIPVELVWIYLKGSRQNV